MSDFEDREVHIAGPALEPLLSDLEDALAQEGVASETVRQVFAVAGELYLAGYRDGQRHAVGQIAPEAARHGLDLWLAPELEEPPAG